MKRDCVCPRAKHQHGTALAYNQDRCRCIPCADAHRRHRKHWARRTDLERQAGLPVGLTDAAGTRRRMQALSVVGWSTTHLGAELGVSQQRAYELLTTPSQVRSVLALRVAALYDRAWNVRPDWPGAARTRTNAARRGWHPPLAWDDDEIDDPNAGPHVPSGSYPLDLHPCGTTAAARRHYRRGERLDVACQNAARRQKTQRGKAA